MSEFSPELSVAVDAYALEVSSDCTTVFGRLQYGIMLDGQMRYEFSMHLLTVREDMEIDPDLSGQPRMLEVYARCLSQVGGITSPAQDGGWLADNLVSTDFDALYFAQDLLAKKRRAQMPVPSDTATPS